MDGRTPDGVTRAGMLRLALAGGAAVAGGAVLGARDGGGAPLAASAETDARLLDLFLTLERMQVAFYREAIDKAGLTGDLRHYATTVVGQEEAHVDFLVGRLGNRAGDPPQTDFGEAVTSPERFRDAAIDLEESAIAVYVGEIPNLSNAIVSKAATMASVEARQVAWVRDLKGVAPAPHAADRSRPPEAVLDDLRDRGWLA